MTKEITKLTNDKAKNLKILKDFYVNDWGGLDSYVKNDKILYEIFKKDHDNKDFIIHARVGMLSEMYSARVDNIPDMVEILKKEKGEHEYKSIHDKYCGSKNGNKDLKSFISKYVHWYNEVNNYKAIPIYDSEVREMIFDSFEKTQNGKRTIINVNDKNFTKNSLRTIDSLFEAIDKYIEMHFNDKGTHREKVQIKDLHEEVSIYRLVDKFLWLSSKKKLPNSDKKN